MEDENEDDMYAPDAGDAPSTHPGTDNSSAAIAAATNAREENAEDEEEGEEVEEEESDSVGANVGRPFDIPLISLPLGHRHYH